jgi:hypothetical protein
MQFILGIVIEKPEVGFWLNAACMITDRPGSGCAPTARCYGHEKDL